MSRESAVRTRPQATFVLPLFESWWYYFALDLYHWTMVSSNDDFLVPDGVDLTTKCDTESLIINSSTIFPIGAVLSLVCYLYLLWMYFVVKAPLLKRHPTSKEYS